MRIISGKYKGKKVDGYTIDGTRPTMDRIKESMVAMIQNYLPGSVCLDLFTGSGSIGLEFLSNGAKKCYFVDNNPRVIETLNKNIKNLKIEEDYELLKGDFQNILEGFKHNGILFDIIFLDPPYKMNYIKPSIELIDKYNLLNKESIIVCEYEDELIDNIDYEIIKEKKYGTKTIMVLKKISR